MEREFHWGSVQDTQRFGLRLGALLRGGDLVVLTGDLGAGKTTLTQSIGDGPRGARPRHLAHVRHRSGAPLARRRAGLVHVDAYRLGSTVELDDLDLDADLDSSVVVVEWGAGLAEQLSDSRLELVITGEVERSVHARAVGARAEQVLGDLAASVA